MKKNWRVVALKFQIHKFLINIVGILRQERDRRKRRGKKQI